MNIWGSNEVFAMRHPLKHLVALAAIAFLMNAAFFSSARAASINDYCDMPPYVVQNVAPNIMILLDNSGSMYDFAYTDGVNNDCSDSSTPCTGFDPTKTYYGYFDPGSWYAYGANNGNNRFYAYASKTQYPANPGSSYWDGNFLNWLAMRRMDIIKKALTGGLIDSGEGTNYDRLVGLGLDGASRGAYKQIASAGIYTPSNIDVNFTSLVSSYGQFSTLQKTTKSGKTTWSSVTFNVKVRVPVPVAGVLQNLVGAKARVGLATYGTPFNQPPSKSRNGDGASVIQYVGGGVLNSVINQINTAKPTANTPLAEALFEVAGYFAQQTQGGGVFSQFPSGPGPNYYGGTYPTSSNKDPYNYGSGGQTSYPSCSQNYVLLITDGESCEDGSLPANLLNYAATRGSPFNCANTGSLSNGDLTGNCPAMCSDGRPPSYYGGTCPSTLATYQASNWGGTCTYPPYAGNAAAGLEDVALWMHDGNNDLRPDLTPTYGGGPHTLSLYTVFAFGQGSTLLKFASINGGFQDINGDRIPTPGVEAEWSTSGDDQPDNYFEAAQGQDLETALTSAFSGMLKRASSGTAASVLASGEGCGANLVQAVFYPKRSFINDVIDWTGSLQNLWYYVDPFFNNSSILEDTVQDDQLVLTDDDFTQLYFDTTHGRTMAHRWPSNSDGTKGSLINPDITFENLSNLWEAGFQLWQRDPSTRTIYTAIDGQTLIPFSTANASTLDPYLQTAGIANGASNLIQWTQGADLSNVVDASGNNLYRSRTVSMIVNGTDEYTHVWKLGDVLDSTPRIVSWVPLGHYDTTYKDTTYGAFINSSIYTGRGTVYAGANDGMLHAFNLGDLATENNPNTPNLKARLTGSGLGSERWAFIPKNALPYLGYIADPDYCHNYTVDLTPYVFDASIGRPAGCTSTNYWDCDKPADGSSWRTILIGGMRLGGASSSSTSCCSSTNTSNGCADCVTTPTTVGGSPVGWSEYFALDVTDENNPVLLWEFTNPGLGFATSGPAVVRESARDPLTGNPVPAKNGRWFVVFGSGPTGPMDTTNRQFLARSNQNLKYFVLDLATGTLLKTIDTGIPYAFSGDLFNATNDSDLDYQDDAIYGGYVARTGTSPNYAWTAGGAGRILTNENITPSDTDNSSWVYSQVINGIGPVTASVARLQNNSTKKLWLYFGTGRFYYSTSGGMDDPSGQRNIFGIADPCYIDNKALFSKNPNTGLFNCPAPLSGTGSLGWVDTSSGAGNANGNGWYINLDPAGTYVGADGVSHAYGAERIITDPLASTTGVVYFTSYKPYDPVSYPCGVGGNSFLWAVKYDSGAAPSGYVKGTALLQVSTGSIQQLNLSNAFTGEGGRRSASIEGVPPTAQGLSLFTSPPPVKRIIHVREEK